MRIAVLLKPLIWLVDQFLNVVLGSLSLSIFSGLIISLWFAWRTLVFPLNDTTKITNIALAILAPLTAICFSAARVTTDDKSKKVYFQAGEHCFHASIMVLCGSIIKYGVLEINKLDPQNIIQELVKGFSWILGFDVGLLFIGAIILTYQGLRSLNELLLSRVVMPHIFTQIK